MVATWRRSWGLVRLSGRILRQDKFLALYPLIAFGLMLTLGFVALLLFGMMVAIVGAYHDGQLNFLALSPAVQFIGILFLAVVTWGFIIIATYSQVGGAGGCDAAWIRGHAARPG